MAEAALERLREAIIMGELTPGTPLRLEDLGRRLGMSISPIREALRQLEALGLAEHLPHHGAKVMRLDVEECASSSRSGSPSRAWHCAALPSSSHPPTPTPRAHTSMPTTKRAER